MSEQYGNLPDGFFLSEKEIEDLRNSKKELTDYGRKKLRELMNKEPLQAKVSEKDFNKIVDAFNKHNK